MDEKEREKLQREWERTEILIADRALEEEYYLAGVEVVRKAQKKLKSGESFGVTVSGKIGDWKIEKYHGYYTADAPEGRGLLLKTAIRLHEMKYPLNCKGQPKIYGKVVRVQGDGNCPHPSKRAEHFSAEGLLLTVDPTGKEQARYLQIIQQHPNMRKDYNRRKFVPSLEGEIAKSTIDSYHIDNLLGLREFARAVKGEF